MKIAIVTDDQQTISQHFGRANFYQVLTIENGEIVARETREKAGHKNFANQAQQHEHAANLPHGFDPASQARHSQMVEVITDCEALICRGMGFGAYKSMEEHGLRPIITDIREVDEAALAYAQGRIVNHTEKLH